MHRDISIYRSASVAAAGAARGCPALVRGHLDEPRAEVAAELFKALADRTRVRILNLLAARGSAVCVCDITEAVGLSQPTVSFHLKKLLSAGLLDREQRGTWAYYSLNTAAMEQLENVFRREGGPR